MCSPTDAVSNTAPNAILRPSLAKANSGRRYRYGERSSHNKSVTFGTIESKTYETIRGHRGLDARHPLALGWNCVEKSDAISIDQYEDTRPERATQEELLTEPKERKRMIKNSEQKLGNGDDGKKKRQSLPRKMFRMLSLRA